nr:zinc finger BED domain-containing protein 4-like [Nothobranchius furzeri]
MTKRSEIDKLLMEMIATDILPYAVVEGVGFKRLVAKLEQRYSLKNEKYFRTKLMGETYQKVVNKVKQLLHADNSGPLAFTTDCWSGAGEALVSLTAHFIDKSWQRIQLVLNVKTMFGSHTGEYIRETFLNLLKEWDIDHERVHLVLRDSGANMVKGMRLAELPGLSCTAHTLQLVINDGLSAQRAVGDMLAKFKRIATHFNHSTVAQQCFASRWTTYRYKHRPLDQEILSQAKSWLQEEMQSQTSEETKLAIITEEEEDPKRRRVGTESIVDCLFDNMLAASTSEEEQSDDVLEELERGGICLRWPKNAQFDPSLKYCAPIQEAPVYALPVFSNPGTQGPLSRMFYTLPYQTPVFPCCQTPDFNELLHWLSVNFWVNIKILVMVFRALHGKAHHTLEIFSVPTPLAVPRQHNLNKKNVHAQRTCSISQ